MKLAAMVVAVVVTTTAAAFALLLAIAAINVAVVPARVQRYRRPLPRDQVLPRTEREGIEVHGVEQGLMSCAVHLKEVREELGVEEPVEEVACRFGLLRDLPLVLAVSWRGAVAAAADDAAARASARAFAARSGRNS